MPHAPPDETPARRRGADAGRPKTPAGALDARAAAGASAMPDVQTFELYLTRCDGVTTFEALTCRPVEIVTRVRSRLVDVGAACADIRQAGRPLFILEWGPPPP